MYNDNVELNERQERAQNISKLISNSDFRLDMKNRKWRLMPMFGTSRNEFTISNSQKYCKVEPPIACEKASLLAYGPYLYLFGGYGPAPEQFHNYPVDPIFDLDPTSS